ncbi:MAG: 30S ribosomal protein S7, partial [Myxococcota bacterium]|nr:30S ribosomal protein S7 [Myxococcota bacterium]
MSRRGGIQKREITPDARYQDKLVARLIAYLMLDGKKSVAEGIVYGAFDIIKDKVSEEPVTVFKQALDHIRPSYEVKSRRVGGASYQVPVE